MESVPVMELPFAFEESSDSSSDLAMMRSPSQIGEDKSIQSVKNLPRIPHYYENVNIKSSSKIDGSQNKKLNIRNLHRDQRDHNLSGMPSQTTNLLSYNTTKANGNSLHRVALYENLHTQFYNPPSKYLPENTSKTPENRFRQSPNTEDQNEAGGMEFEEDSFVTVCEGDVDEEGEEDFHHEGYSNLSYPQHRKKDQKHQETISSVNIHTVSSHQPDYQDFYGTQCKTSGLDILSLLLSSSSNTCTSSSHNQHQLNNHGSNVFNICQMASNTASIALKYASEGNIHQCIAYHTRASKFYRQAAIQIKNLNEANLSLLSYSLLVLSHSQARIADTMLKNGGASLYLNSNRQQNNWQSDRKTHPFTKNPSTTKTIDPTSPKVTPEENLSGRATANKERLRATIRASMGKVEADMTDSTFLARVAKTGPSHLDYNSSFSTKIARKHHDKSKVMKIATTNSTNCMNPVDDMLELERELNFLDMTLDIGVGLGAASTTNTMTVKKTVDGDGSFYMIPSGSSYMSSSMMWLSGVGRTQQQPSSSRKGGMAGVRARANKVQTILSTSSLSQQKPSIISTQVKQNQNTLNSSMHPKYQSTSNNVSGLESSWWGHASTLASSTTSLSNSMIGIRSSHLSHQSENDAIVSSPSPTNTKQLMRLLDSLKTLGDENASLLKELEDAKKARLEAKATRESMKLFKEEYSKRFGTLKAALNKFRKEYRDHNHSNASGSAGNTAGGTQKALDKISSNIVAKSDFVRNATQAELQKRDLMIQKLAKDLKQERDESKKKDDALRKFENFYKEIKARSAQKARQREQEKHTENSKTISKR